MTVRREMLLVAVGLTGYALLALTAVRDKSLTFDEPALIVGGLSYWQYHDYRMHTANGHLPQRWCALPLLLLGLDPPLPADDPAWRTSDIYVLSSHVLANPRVDWARIRWWSRVGMLTWGVLTLLLVYLWSRALFGRGGGLLSLTAGALDPTMLAHGPLATSDMCVTFFFLFSLAAVWRCMQRMSPGRLALACLAVGGLLVAKHSAVLILPAAAMLALVRLRWGPPWQVRGWRGPTRRIGRTPGIALLVGGAMAVALFAGLTVWTCFGWRYDMLNQAHLPAGEFFLYPTWTDLLNEIPGLSHAVLAGAARWRLLPEAYLFGLGFVQAKMPRQSFLCGHYSVTGVWWYFPFTFAVKTALPLLGGLLLALAALTWRAWRRGGGRWAYRLAPLLLWLVIYSLVAVASNLNIGHRHLLPIYPPLFILLGALAAPGRCSAWRRGATALLLLGMAANAAWAYPHYLAYFNGVVRRDQAYRYLVDSNLDWDQDLPALHRWLDQQRQAGALEGPVYLAYFGTDLPTAYGIDAIPLHTGADDYPVRLLTPGVYCISATTLQGMYLAGWGPWTRLKEAEYQRRRQRLLELGAMTEIARAQAGVSAAQWRDRVQWHRHTELLRLLAGLRDRIPDANLGGSILIYRIDAQLLAELLIGPAPAQTQHFP